MKNYIFGTGYHGRQIFRKLYDKKKFIGFFDNNKKLETKKLFGKKIYYINKINKTKFDKIYIGGSYTNEIRNQLINILNVNKNKIIQLSRDEIKLKKKYQILREDKLNKLLKNFDTITKLYNINYSLINSSLIGLFRNEILSSFSDVDICLEIKEFKKLINILNKKKINYKTVKYDHSSKFYNKGDLRKIILKSKSVFKYYEPAILDIIIIYKKNQFIYQPIHKKKFLKYRSEDFAKKRKFIYGSIALNIPTNSERVLKMTYGKNWKLKKNSKYWQNTNYKNMF